MSECVSAFQARILAQMESQAKCLDATLTVYFWFHLYFQNALDKNLLTSFQVSGASCSAREINGYYDLTLENSFGQPAYRRRGDADTWLICFRSGSANIWNITEERARGNMYTGFAYICCSADMTPDHSLSSWRVYNEGAQILFDFSLAL